MERLPSKHRVPSWMDRALSRSVCSTGPPGAVDGMVADILQREVLATHAGLLLFTLASTSHSRGFSQQQWQAPRALTCPSCLVCTPDSLPCQLLLLMNPQNNRKCLRQEEHGGPWPPMRALRSGSSDPYCLVKVDDEVVARTATVWRSLSPFWGEEYTVHLPQDFHHLAFYVLDQDTVGHDDVIGKISLSKEAITADPRGIDSWINLSHVDPDAEVQGEVCLAVQVLDDAGGRCLRCHIRQARDLAPRDISGTSDPFARVFWGSQSSETSIIKKTRFPHWDEVLELRAAPGAVAPLRVELWDWDMVGKNDFLGMVEFSPQALLQRPPNGWFHLLPFPTAAEDAGGSLGALRVKVRLTEDRVLPSEYYRPLAELLEGSVWGPVEPLPAPPRVLQHPLFVASHLLLLLQDVKYLAISGFLFLRFFAPAILTPKLFDLRDQHADPQTSRSLLLLAKAVQSIGNLGQQLGQGKELWMAPLHPFLLQSVARVRDFLDQLVDVNEEQGSPTRALMSPSETVREGYLLKRREEQGGLTPRFAFKKRYFWLSGDSLAYAKSPEGQARVSLAVRCIQAVERVDEGAFQLPHVMQVVTGDEAGAQRTTYLQCKPGPLNNSGFRRLLPVRDLGGRGTPAGDAGAKREGR
ncbi:PREDICTED: rasGAP-activating-like protein 1 [Dipodomys ordii]|uniref:RasGAP-activating-like protein 1 n=1 Tax=Dipodomys ordii TaxID=10020 RepID=A0A1S3F1V6_DIPOR|nr:PREDICTED: rasGAP-activating-like protein 1 [Dipodomys ordii]